MAQAYYSNSIQCFLEESIDSIIGKLNAAGTQFTSQYTYTTISWKNCVKILKDNVAILVSNNKAAGKWTILLEYEIPRIHNRIDAVLIADDLIFVIEYKDERKIYEPADKRQVEDYALDLKDFHLESRDRIIIPILLAPLAPIENNDFSFNYDKQVQVTIKSNAANFGNVILASYNSYHKEGNKIDAKIWENSMYSPTPTIIQAAQALFAGHSVESITKSGAAQHNLTETTDYVLDTIRKARANNKKVVCFVTGVPGAGKTLVGLNIIHRKEFESSNANAAYFSGNGPLIKVLREALIRDEYNREEENNIGKRSKPNKKAIARKVEPKIQNLHSFIKEGIRNKKALSERIVIFDEAQRCWTAEHFYNKTVRNQNREQEDKRFDPIKKSEAEVLFEVMSRHKDWAVIIALVGNGQEINTGEAGIEEWIKVLEEKYSDWEVHLSPELLYDGNLITQKRVLESSHSLSVFENKFLHLSINQRSFKANNLNEWVNAVLSSNPDRAKNLLKEIGSIYPILVTRSLDRAKQWLRNIKQGNKRIGLIASSGAQRLRPYGISTKESIDEAMWFLNNDGDIRSSNHLELVATEFAIQGLEIDWACLCWDADLLRIPSGWDFKNFVGTEWQQVGIKNENERKFILNTYRVLLTRAREGLIIFVPEGDSKDETRLPRLYDPVFNYLKSCGVAEL
jgi:hypothetical protein